MLVPTLLVTWPSPTAWKKRRKPRNGRVVITGMLTHRMYTLDPGSGAFAIHEIPVRRANPRAAEVTADGTWWVLWGLPRRVARCRDGARASWEIGMYPHMPTRGALIRHLDIDRRTGDVWAAHGAAPSRAPARIVRLTVRD